MIPPRLFWLLPFLIGVAEATSAVPRASGPTLAALVALVTVGVGARPWLRAATSRPLPEAADLPGRDLDIDLLRGLAILFVAVDHIGLPSLYYQLSAERIGVITGAELFVVLSGTVLGLTFRRRGREDTWRREVGRVLVRARTLYLVAVLVALGAYLVSQLPGINPTELTTYTEDGTVYPTYTLTQGPLTFLADVLLLKSGPWPFNIMGLYVVLLLTPPLLLGLLRGRVIWVLAEAGRSTSCTPCIRSGCFPPSSRSPFPC